MHRILTTTEALARGETALSKADAKHLRALRLEDGEAVEFFDGRGRTRAFAWSAATGSFGAPGALNGPAPRPKPLTLFACVTKGSRWDWTLEKATELGVTRIVPVISARTIVRIAADDVAAKGARWRRVTEDAARQSDALWLPEILPPTAFDAALPLVARTRCFVGALTDPPSAPILAARCAHAAEPMPPDGTALFVGPEGDFSPDELSALIRLAIPVSFGPTVLRAETAAIFGASVLAAAAAAGDAT